MDTRPIPAPQAPKSGWKRPALWIVGGLAVGILIPVVAIFLFLFAVSHSMDEQGKKVSAADALERLVHPGYQIGEVVPVGDLGPYKRQVSTLEVTAFSCGPVIGSTGTAIAGGPFCTVAVTMVNTKATDDHVFDLPQYLEAVRADGTSIRMNLGATNAANRDPKPYAEVVHPGQSIKARLLFDAPVASGPIVAIVLYPSELTEHQAGVDFTLTDEQRKRQPPMAAAVPWHAPGPTEDPLSSYAPYTPRPLETPKPRKTPVPTYDRTLPRIGKAVTVGGATFVVSAFHCEPALRLPVSRDVIPAFGHYCAVSVSLTNHTRTTQSFGFQRIEGYLARKLYTFDILASEDAAGDKGILFREIQPNQSLKVVVLFDMPTGYRLDTVKLVGFNSAASTSVQLR